MPPFDPRQFEQALKQLDNQMHILVLVQGKLTDGRSHYAYVSIAPSRYEAFKRAEAAGNYNLAEYGLILEHGEGENPPTEVMLRMEQEHGASHVFESQLAELLGTLQQKLPS